MTLPNTVLSFLQQGILYYNAQQFTVVKTKVYYSMYYSLSVHYTVWRSIH